MNRGSRAARRARGNTSAGRSPASARWWWRTRCADVVGAGVARAEQALQFVQFGPPAVQVDAAGCITASAVPSEHTSATPTRIRGSTLPVVQQSPILVDRDIGGTEHGEYANDRAATALPGHLPDQRLRGEDTAHFADPHEGGGYIHGGTERVIDHTDRDVRGGGGQYREGQREDAIHPIDEQDHDQRPERRDNLRDTEEPIGSSRLSLGTSVGPGAMRCLPRAGRTRPPR